MLEEVSEQVNDTRALALKAGRLIFARASTATVNELADMIEGFLQKAAVVELNKPKFTIITGNPVDGMELYGLFEDETAASAHANQDADLPESWWTMEIQPLEKQEEPQLFRFDYAVRHRETRRVVSSGSHVLMAFRTSLKAAAIGWIKHYAPMAESEEMQVEISGVNIYVQGTEKQENNAV